MIPSLRDHTSAIVDALTAAGVLVGDAEPPEGAGFHGKVFTAYVFVTPLYHRFDGPLGCPWDDGHLTWQVTCVGESRLQCEGLVDVVNAVLIGGTVDVADRGIPMLAPVEGVGGVTRQNVAPSPDRPVFVATPQYRAFTTPSQQAGS